MKIDLDIYKNIIHIEDGYCGHEHIGAFSLVNMNARLYDPWAARFLSPDPYVQLPDFTQSLNRYSYCLNNPLRLVDPEGENPVYNKNGHFIGLTQEGFTGDIIICTAPGKYKFHEYTAAQLLNEKDVYTMDDCMKSDLSDPNHLAGWAMSNIWTDVVRYYERIYHLISQNGIMFGPVFSLNSVLGHAILYNKMTIAGSLWETNLLTGAIYSDGSYVNYYESTVENIANSIIYHEWYGHLMLWYGSHIGNHYKVYEFQMQSPLWESTTLRYKFFVWNSYFNLNMKETILF